ncbi:MAG: T9SS type A sorting domain-containing protein [Bacteroidetes bacterium]|nr:T9SS type A sorting domain-containing protein [Bacteroidota bacterium]
MRNFSGSVFTIFGILLLTTLCFPSFSQVRGLKAVNDTIDLYPGVELYYNILGNDTISSTDTLRIVSLNGGGRVVCRKFHGATWQFSFSISKWGNNNDVIGSYILSTMSGDTGSAKILFRIHDNSFGYLDINNISARFNASGLHFFYENAEFVAPKGSGKTSMFSNSLWIGGVEGEDSLHFAGERYRQGPSNSNPWYNPDFYAGPIMDSTKYSIYQDTIWNRIWNLKKSDIDYHKTHYTESGYKPIHDILEWPGNGNTSLGQASKLAPFFDVNEDGLYEPLNGDYPEIRGDQALFFIFNDDRGPHRESMGAKLKVEIHGMAYAFYIPEDSALKNTIFLNYKIYNRSQITYDSTLLGVYSDIDLGYAMDDYVACDVKRSMYYGYNGTPVDGTGQSYAYGAHPPVQAVAILAGPYMDPDGLDNPRYDNTGALLCDFSINGQNFGDSIVDNERFGMTKFMYIGNSASGIPSYMTDPQYAQYYYLFLSGKWKDGSRMIYGGNGHAGAGGYGPECNFMFPGLSDSLNWGTGGFSPNGPKDWTETTASNNPGDRRGLGVTGPFTFKPGDVQELDIAFIFAWAKFGTDTLMNSLQKLQMATDTVNKSFATNRLPNGNSFNGINDHAHMAEFPVNIFPNPASDHLNVEFAGKNLPAGSTIDLMTSQGRCLQRIVTMDHQKSVQFNISGMSSGLYLIQITTRESTVVKKVVVMH